MKPKLSKWYKRRYELAEEACRAFRWCIGRPVCEVTAADWNHAASLLVKWIPYAGKSAFEKPKK